MFQFVHKIHSILSRKEKRQLLFLSFAVLIMAFMETFGVAAIMPFMTLVANPDAIHHHRFLADLYNHFNFHNYRSFIIAFGLLVLTTLIITNMVGALTNWGLLRFSWMRNHTIAKRLLSQYLNQPYSFFLDRNSSHFHQSILNEVQQVILGCLIPGLIMASKLIVSLFIFTVLFVIEPLLALSLFLVLGTAYAGVYIFTRKKLSLISRERVNTNVKRFKIVGESFGGIKDIKLLGKENIFVKMFENPSIVHSKHSASTQIISTIPRYALEVIAFGGLIIIILYLLATNKDLTQIIPLAGLYAFAGLRLMPALQQVFIGLTQIRAGLGGLDMLYKDLNKTIPTLSTQNLSQAIEALPFTQSLQLKNITFKYSSSKKMTLNNLNLTIPALSIVGLVGPTGSGKTTLVDIILGLLPIHEGQILVDNVVLEKNNLPRWQKNLGYVPQQIYLCDDTIKRNIAFGIPEEEINQTTVEQVAKMASLHDFITKELPKGYETLVGERGIRLSGGQRQRIGIARALYHNPEIIILDEATSALDSATESVIMDTIHALAGKKTIIIIAHRFSTIKQCDKIFIIKDGTLLDSGTYDSLLNTQQYFKKLGKLA